MKPIIKKNRANPEHMTSFVVPTMLVMLFVVTSMSRLGIPASKKQATKTTNAGKTCFIMCNFLNGFFIV